MLTSKQRAFLRGLANTIPATQQIGKEGVTDNVAQQAALELKAKELIKIKVLETALLTAREASEALCEMLEAERQWLPQFDGRSLEPKGDIEIPENVNRRHVPIDPALAIMARLGEIGK